MRRAAASFDDPREELIELRGDLEDLKTRVLRSWSALTAPARLELNGLWVAAGEQFTRLTELTTVARANGRPVMGASLYPIRSRLREIRDRARTIAGAAARDAADPR